MTIIMGGSGSVGSTLLATMLNRHNRLYCGPELSVFNKEVVFTNWSKARELMLSRPDRFITWGWGPYSGSNLLHEDYGWGKDELESVLRQVRSVVEFADQFFEKSLSSTGKSTWVEKTPSNALCFPEFLDTFGESRVVHIIRNPHDSVASLVRRGFTPIYATGIWVYNCAMGLRARQSERYHELNYERLTSRTKETVEALTRFLELEFDEGMLSDEENYAPKNSLPSWSFDPSESARTSRIGSFQRAPVAVQDEIRTALSVFRISEKHQRAKRVPAASCEEICDLLKYDFEPFLERRFRVKISLDFAKDMFKRTLRRYRTGIGNLPAKLSW